MQQFIEYLLKNIISKPEELKISTHEEEGRVVYVIKAAKEDMGTIIGKEGRNIKSIRNLAKSKAIKDNVHIKIVLEEEDGLPQDTEENA